MIFTALSFLRLSHGLYEEVASVRLYDFTNSDLVHS